MWLTDGFLVTFFLEGVEFTYVWRGHSCVRVTHMWRGHSCVAVTHMWKGHSHVRVTHVWRGHSHVAVTHMCGTSHQSEILHSLIFYSFDRPYQPQIVDIAKFQRYEGSVITVLSVIG